MNLKGYTEVLKERGYYCFPTYGYEYGKKFKKPKCRGGFYGNNLSIPTIFDPYGNDNWNETAVSIWCGTLLAIDCDGEAGTNNFAELMKKLGIPFDLERDFTIRTPRNGYHFYYKAPENHAFIKNSAGVLGEHIDVRGCRGYVVCPGVQRPIGNTIKIYNPNSRFLDSDYLPIPSYKLPECPKPLLELLSTDDSITERQLGLLSLLPEPYRYVYDYLDREDVKYMVLKDGKNKTDIQVVHSGFDFSNAKKTQKEKAEKSVTQNEPEKIIADNGKVRLEFTGDINAIEYPTERIDISPNYNYHPSYQVMERLKKYANKIPNSKDRDNQGRRVEGHTKTLKVISFAFNTLAKHDTGKARRIIDKWNDGLDWWWEDEVIEAKLLYVAKDYLKQKIRARFGLL